MTLVVSLEDVKGNFTALGDLLLSQRTRPSRAPDFPTRPYKDVVDNKQIWFPSALTQKILILRPNVLLIWSGPMDHIRRMCDFLEYDLPKPEPTCEVLIKALVDFEALHPHPLDLTFIIFCTDNNVMYQLYCRVESFRIANLGTLNCLGTGSGDFRDFIKIYEDLATVGDDFLFGPAALANYAAQTSLLQRQFGHGIENAFGGGFEIAVINGGRFQKLDNILHVYVICRDLSASQTIEEIRIELLELSIQYYFEDFLLITSNVLGENARGFAVPPPRLVGREGHVLTNDTPPPVFTSVTILFEEAGLVNTCAHSWLYNVFGDPAAKFSYREGIFSLSYEIESLRPMVNQHRLGFVRD